MPTKNSNGEGPQGRRKAGKPRRGQEVITPEVLDQMADMWLKGGSEGKIAKRFDVARATVRYHIEHHIKPIWHEQLRSRLAEDLAKVALLERVSWEQFETAEPSETREGVKKALLERGVKPRLVEQATTKITRRGQVAWLEIVQWCIEFRAKVFGHFAPTRHKIDLGGELRVAGMSPTEVDQAMLEQLLEKVAERRRHRAGLEFREN